MKWVSLTVALAVGVLAPCQAWDFFSIEEAEEVEIALKESRREFAEETFERAYGYLRGGAAFVGGTCLVGLAAGSIISPPVASLSILFFGVGAMEVQHAREIIDYSNESTHNWLAHEIEDIPLWEAVDRFGGWQALVDQGLLSSEEMRVKFYEDTESYPLHEIERFYSLPAVVAQDFLLREESKTLLDFHREFQALQKDEEKIRESLSSKYVMKVGKALEGFGIKRAWTTKDFIFFKITPEKVSVAFSEDLQLCMKTNHLNGEVEAYNRELLEEAAEDYQKEHQSWLKQVKHLDERYLKWHGSITRD